LSDGAATGPAPGTAGAAAPGFTGSAAPGVAPEGAATVDPDRAATIDPDRAVIVVFGAAVRPGGRPSPTLRRRVAAAARLGRTLEEALLLPTGGVGRHGPAEARVMAVLLQHFGIPAGRILEEPTAADTLESARAVAALLPGHRGRVLAVSSGYHLRRCVLLLRLMGLRAEAGAAARAAPGFRAGHLHLREWAATPYDAALAVWHRWRGHQRRGAGDRRRA